MSEKHPHECSKKRNFAHNITQNYILFHYEYDATGNKKPSYHQRTLLPGHAGGSDAGHRHKRHTGTALLHGRQVHAVPAADLHVHARQP